jgi:hypothetical protein
VNRHPTRGLVPPSRFRVPKAIGLGAGTSRSLGRLGFSATVVVLGLSVGCETDRQYGVTPVPCSNNAECCVVRDTCNGRLLVVARQDVSAAASWVGSQSPCKFCGTPGAQIRCAASGYCEAVVAWCPSPATLSNHCGDTNDLSTCNVADSGADDAGSAFDTPDAGFETTQTTLTTCE